MADGSHFFDARSIDELLNDPSSLKELPGLSAIVEAFLNGEYAKVLCQEKSRALFTEFRERQLDKDRLAEGGKKTLWSISADEPFLHCAHALLAGLAAFNAFLQANVTGPPLSSQSLLWGAENEADYVKPLKEALLKSLTTEGLSVYQYIPHVELFCFAKAMFTDFFPQVVNGKTMDSKWMRIRINTYHQRLLSSGTSNSRLSDSAAILQIQIEADLLVLERELLDVDSTYSTESKVQFLLEKAQIYIMQGLDLKSQANVQQAKSVSDFSYALSGALGKRTKFQQKETSQLVVFAKSKNDLAVPKSTTKTSPSETVTGVPTALNLNDDTLLESIDYSKASNENSTLPPELLDLQPDDQPQLNPLDQIILLTEATLKDTLSPLDKLNSEEILPFAVRVLSDKPTNWQIYTQALLVRSRIEAHRSRTQERSVLQLQAIVDQIIADTQEEPSLNGGDGVPQIQVTQFFPRAKASESAPIMERLKFIYQLNSPTRWEIETELAYAWSNAGSLVSALEIFKRLRLWAEVALCFHSVGQEGKARQIVRRQLYYSKKGPDMDQYHVDSEEIITEEWEGEMRSPPPAHAPRLWCILGDLEQDPSCWLRAWEISNKRFARAQRTLGEYYTRQGDLASAREAYMKATVVNRQNSESWSRLGDIDLRVGNWDGAIIAFQQSIMIDDDDAKTYSNLGSALLSKHAEIVKLHKVDAAAAAGHVEDIEIRDDEELAPQPKTEAGEMKPKEILRQALIAYKRAASIANGNWQIWDNVVTIAGRMSPPSFPDILMGVRAVIRIRSPTVGEDSIDIAILTALIGEVISRERPEKGTTEGGIYVPPRGSLARAVIEMVDAEIVPLITVRAELWALVEKLKLYRRDFAAALSCAEKRWRIATAGEEWLENVENWKHAADATDGLVSAYENYGPQDKADGDGEVEKGWKMKARSAVRGVMGKAKNIWDDTAEFDMLKERLEDLKSS